MPNQIINNSAERKQFTFYSSFWEAVKELPKKQRGEILEAIVRYALEGEETKLSGVSSAIFVLVKPNLDASKRKSENGKRGGAQKKNESKTEANEKQNESNGNVESKKENEIEVEEEVEIENECYIHPKPPTEDRPSAKPVVRFSKPTVSDVADYCRERHNTVNAQQFYDHYESNGWRVGKNPMKDWRAAVRTWERMRMDRTEQQHRTTPDEIREMAARGEFDDVEVPW